MKESYFQKSLVDKLKNAGYVVLNLSDKYTVGIPDIYCAKDGESFWYELKVVNKAKGKIRLGDLFTKIQKAQIQKLNKAGVNASGLIRLVPHKKTLVIKGEDLDRVMDIEELLEYPEFKTHP